MLFYLVPFFYSLVFLLFLELLVLSPERFIMFYVLASGTALYAGKKIGNQWLDCVLPFVLAQGSAGLSYLVDDPAQKQAILLISFFFFYLSLISAVRLVKNPLDQTAKGMNAAASAAAIFFAFSFVYGFYLNFLIPVWLLMLIFAVITFLVSYQFFSLIAGSEKSKVLIYSFVLAFSLAEIIWTINFWPFGYLTGAVIALILYYLLWDLIHAYFLDKLSRKKVVASMIFFSIIIAMVLISSKWLPVT